MRLRDLRRHRIPDRSHRSGRHPLCRAVAWSRALRTDYLTTDAVLIEYLNHFASPVARPRALQLLDRIRPRADWTVLPVDRSLVTGGVELYRDRPDKYWSLTDCISFTVMTENQISQALAYDHHFEQAGFEALLRRDPP